MSTSSSPSSTQTESTGSNPMSSNTNTSDVPVTTAMNADLSALAAALSSTDLSAEQEQELSTQDLAALLKQLERADGVARGVEDRLDGIISGLDALLGSLQVEDVPEEEGEQEDEDEDEAKDSEQNQEGTTARNGNKVGEEPLRKTEGISAGTDTSKPTTLPSKTKSENIIST
jgi:hypothetical protein